MLPRTMEQYIRQLMKNITGDDCFEGGELEIRLFAERWRNSIMLYTKRRFIMMVRIWSLVFRQVIITRMFLKNKSSSLAQTE